MISVQSLRVTFGARVLFDDLSFTVRSRERIAFAGHNGAGKSTLMKCIAGLLPADSGRVVMPKGARAGYLPQEGIHVTGRTVWQEAEAAFGEMVGLRERIERLSHELERLDPRSSPYAEALDEIGGLELRLEAADPSRMKPRIESVLKGLGFRAADFTRDCSEFSGGWQMRIAMARLFLGEPEVLLLDEPTNHLDIDTQQWMEQYLRNYPGAILLISHDRGLLDGLCTRTLAFTKGRVEEYAGNFSYYEREWALRRETQQRQYDAQQREIAQIRRFIDRFRASANKASLVQSRIKMLEKIVPVPEPEQADAVMGFRFPVPPPSGHLVAKLEGVTKRYGALEVFRGFDFEIVRGEKIAVVGPNGAGKSTFCRIITAQEAPDDGAHGFGHKVAVSSFSQNHADELDPHLTVLETVEAAASRESAHQARDLLGCFLFRGDDVFKKVGVLSGGERSRVALVCMLLRPANFLILDEPTNHLDMQSQDVLQRALCGYAGSVLIVSHNRSFLDPVVTKTLEFRQGHPPRLFHGNIGYYLDKTAAERSAAPPPATHSKPPSAQSSSRKDQRRAGAEARDRRNRMLKPLESELAALEERIALLEQQQAAAGASLSDPGTAADAERFRDVSVALAGIVRELEQGYSRWDQLSDEIERVTAALDREAMA